jgi:RIO kinase 2
MHDGCRVYIIDWPQWVSTDHPNAGDLLARDIGNITRFFNRRYKLKVTSGQALEVVTGEGLRD